MIVFDLECEAAGHRFEGWFGSSGDFTDQQGRGLLSCPSCGSTEVRKAVMAPHVGRKGNQVQVAAARAPVAAEPAQPASQSVAGGIPAEAAAMLRAMAAMQAEALKSSTWVGDRFAEDVRAMHYGEKDAALIHGQATPDDARELIEEGIEIAPVLFPVVPPERAN